MAALCAATVAVATVWSMAGPGPVSAARAALVGALRPDLLFQADPKLAGAGSVGAANFGTSVAISGDGDTAIVGAPGDAGGFGAAWIFVRTGSAWTEQAAFVPGDEAGQGRFGSSVALSDDGDTALIGAPADNGGYGAAWVYTRSGTTWTEQAKLTGDGPIGSGEQGYGAFGASVALSSSGDVALAGAPQADSRIGAAWAFMRSGTGWSALGAEMTISVANNANAAFGSSVALSGTGTTLLIGAPQDDAGAGAAYVFTLVGPVLTLAAEIPGTQPGATDFGQTVALSADASTGLVAGLAGSDGRGEAWVLTGSPSAWTPLASPLLPTGESGSGNYPPALTLSANGSVAVLGGPPDNGSAGAAWVFAPSGSSWTQQGSKLTPRDETGAGEFGSSVGLSADGSTALVGAPADGSGAGAAWVFSSAPPACQNVAATAAGVTTIILPLPCHGPVGVSLTYAIVRGPAHGTLGPIDQATGAVGYTPAAGYGGTDQFTYDATGPDGTSNVATAELTVTPIPRRAVKLNPRLRFKSHSSRSRTLFSALILTGVPRAAKVGVTCHGRGCPFAARAVRVRGRVVCHVRSRHRRCRREPAPRVGSVALTPLLRHHALVVGGRLTIEVTEPAAIGKVYSFTIRRSRAPALSVWSLAPGSSTPGRGC